MVSNPEFELLNKVFSADHFTTALIDRIVHHVTILAFSGKVIGFGRRWLTGTGKEEVKMNYQKFLLLTKRGVVKTCWDALYF